ncbi:MAG: hypothetical protein SO293_04015 [Alloprevotella sp.]|nr:hypothetical protein [Bacteroidales bacterium]MDY4740461.1 hypothetical protein [Alloprevotella sp.]
MRKSLLSLLVLFVYSLVAFAQQGTEITWSGKSDWNTTVSNQISLAKGDWSITAYKERGSNAPIIASANDFRSYPSNVVMVMNNAQNMGKLVFHMSTQGKQQWSEVTASEGNVTYDTENGLTIWEGDAQYVMFTVGSANTYGTNKSKTTGQFDFSSVTAYTKAELTVTEPEPDPEVQAALTAALADAQETIALRGPGYPVAEGESYNALNAAIATAQALTNPTAADVEALTAAVRTYKCATNVEMPAVNHKYAFAITYQGETKYYLQNAGTQNGLKAYVAEEELTDNLIFKCVDENEGKFTFTNSDGKYLTITQPAKSWLNPNNTGVSEEKNENTDVTFAKFSKGSKVEVADEAELFGLLSWYGIRGYNTDKKANENGYLVVNHSTGAFDGADAPYYNSNFTSAIKLIDLGVDPTLLTSVTPATTDTLEALPEQVVFTFEKDVQEVTSVRLRHNGWGGMRGTELVGEEGLVVTNADTVTVNVPASLVQGVTQMSLTVMGTAIDGGALSDGENGEMVVVQYQYTPNPARFVFVEANPADSSTVEKLDSIIVTFAHPAGGNTGGFAKDAELNVLAADGTVVTTATIDFDMATDEGWNSNALITLAEPVTTNGTYTITVPEATVYDENYNDNFEDYGVADWGAIYNPEFTLTYTVEAPEEYPINFPREQVRTRTDRSLSSVSLTAEGQAEQTLTVDYMHPYNDLTEDEGSRLTVPAGATLTTTFNYNGLWMHGYVYIDLDNDKQFSFIDGNTDQTGTDLQTFSFYSGSFTNDAAGYNSLGAYITGDARSVLNPPTFQAPSTPGEYRIRFKVDWNSVDAGGQKAADGTCTGHNGILSNGGYIVDAILVVTGESTGINAATLDENAKVYTLDGRRVIVNGKLNRGFYIINGQKTFVK